MLLVGEGLEEQDVQDVALSSGSLSLGLQAVEPLDGLGMPVLREREPCQENLFYFLEVRRMVLLVSRLGSVPLLRPRCCCCQVPLCEPEPHLSGIDGTGDPGPDNGVLPGQCHRLLHQVACLLFLSLRLPQACQGALAGD